VYDKEAEVSGPLLDILDEGKYILGVVVYLLNK
jgi:hypothetical protein